MTDGQNKRGQEEGPRKKNPSKNIEDEIDGGSPFFLFKILRSRKNFFFFFLVKQNKIYEEGHMNLCVCVLDARYV